MRCDLQAPCVITHLIIGGVYLASTVAGTAERPQMLPVAERVRTDMFSCVSDKANIV